MNEVIEALKEAAITQTIPLDLPDEDDLVEIEEQLLLPIPAALKTFLLNVSDLVCGSIEPVTVCDPHAHTHLPEVTAEAWAQGLPRDLMPICQTNHCYYCINQEGNILSWQHGEFGDEQWEDIWEWAEDVWIKS
ncbi:SMI1/KNR4 family protein [Aliikangiella coralliicola]|uniref:SMI1/KNR4 family protein n=1 Tax=Aliikangiella coralliicola TaxID=2592383 RepID=A0A545UI39_9GAMM|nr:SMI1/KNR4 family protein [Aliikangiella coralliicola]TQV89131.1 SMI1/KNR4 family protein [Aliikangiella coralliicola]